ncbi:MAG: hypothetical protein M1276_03415, partial [Deltaproteobacteria bacterium]|nr:hypothetical protein [Deltaproteobacteria bacterium]
ENFFSPEFINRIDDIVIFSPLTKEEVKKIALMHIETINKTMAEHGKEVIVTGDALDNLVESGYSTKFGARFLKRTIDDIIKVPLTLKWKEGDIFTVELVDGKIVVSANKGTEKDNLKKSKNGKEKYKEEPDYV